MNTLKIKKMFPKLQNQKIDQVQKIINGGESKPKFRINVTTKSPSYKQIIVPMSNEMARKYAKDISIHIISINRALKTIKSNIMVNFSYISKEKALSSLPTMSLHPLIYRKLKKMSRVYFSMMLIKSLSLDSLSQNPTSRS